MAPNEHNFLISISLYIVPSYTDAGFEWLWSMRHQQTCLKLRLDKYLWTGTCPLGTLRPPWWDEVQEKSDHVKRETSCPSHLSWAAGCQQPCDEFRQKRKKHPANHRIMRLNYCFKPLSSGVFFGFCFCFFFFW